MNRALVAGDEFFATFSCRIATAFLVDEIDVAGLA